MRMPQGSIFNWLLLQAKGSQVGPRLSALKAALLTRLWHADHTPHRF